MTKLLIQNGHVIDPANRIDGIHHVEIENGTIAAVYPPEGFTLNPKAYDQIIDATQKIVCPGLVDLRNHVREPGFTHKGNIASETYAAVAGGVTTLCCPPDTRPVIDSPTVIKQIRVTASKEGYCQVLPMAAMTKNLEGNELSEMVNLINAGGVGVSNALKPITNTQVLRRAMEYAASHQIKVFLQPQDYWLAHGGCVHEGGLSSRMGLAGIPETAETIALLRDLELIRLTGVHAHICQISTARGVEIIRQAKAEGLPITCDVSAHHLHLTEMDIDCFNANCHVLPPLRSMRDQDALKQGVVDGTIDAIVSDHQPHDTDAKLAPFAATEPGISAVETLLALSLKMADQINMKRSDLIARITCHPARILSVSAGSLSQGARADICIFDPQQHWQVEPRHLHSRGKNTPFQGWELSDKVVKTLVAGEVVFG